MRRLLWSSPAVRACIRATGRYSILFSLSRLRRLAQLKHSPIPTPALMRMCWPGAQPRTVVARAASERTNQHFFWMGCLRSSIRIIFGRSSILPGVLLTYFLRLVLPRSDIGTLQSRLMCGLISRGLERLRSVEGRQLTHGRIATIITYLIIALLAHLSGSSRSS